MPKGERWIEFSMQEQLADALCTPGGGGDCQQTQAAVDLCPARVIQARDYPRHPEHLARNARSDNVGIVGRARGCEGIRLLDPGFDHHIPVKAYASHFTPLKVCPQASKGKGIPIDDDHRMAFIGHEPAHLFADPTATHDDYFHGTPPFINIILWHSLTCARRFYESSPGYIRPVHTGSDQPRKLAAKVHD